MKTKNSRCSWLSIDERTYIIGCKKRGYGVTKIAKLLCRDKGTISREFKRNAEFYALTDERPFEQAQRVQEATRERRRLASSRERLKSPAIREYVEEGLEKFWTPELISGRIGKKIPGASISPEAIYQWIAADRNDLSCYLLIVSRRRNMRRGGKKRRNYNKKQPAAPKTSIDERPVEANERLEIGHLETDAIVSKKSTSALMTTVDRRIRKVFLEKTPSLDSETYSDILIERIAKEVPKKHRHTMTFDNGPENAAHKKIDKALGTKSFFCHPYCASERGTVENRNGFIRWFFPKGTDFKHVPDEYVTYVEDLANNRPMKCLNFDTPNEVWEREIAASRKKRSSNSLPQQNSCTQPP